MIRDAPRPIPAFPLAVFSVSAKAAVGIALPLVAAAGFHPGATHNSPAALRGLLLVFALGPAGEPRRPHLAISREKLPSRSAGAPISS